MTKLAESAQAVRWPRGPKPTSSSGEETNDKKEKEDNDGNGGGRESEDSGGSGGGEPADAIGEFIGDPNGIFENKTTKKEKKNIPVIRLIFFFDSSTIQMHTSNLVLY